MQTALEAVDLSGLTLSWVDVRWRHSPGRCPSDG